jgi:mRNA interferase RelE/StbE
VLRPPSNVIVLPRALRLLRKLPLNIRPAVAQAIDDLANDPRPPGVGPGPDGTHRVKVGDYRIVYDIVDAQITIYVVKVGHRSDVYKGKIR